MGDLGPSNIRSCADALPQLRSCSDPAGIDRATLGFGAFFDGKADRHQDHPRAEPSLSLEWRRRIRKPPFSDGGPESGKRSHSSLIVAGINAGLM